MLTINYYFLICLLICLCQFVQCRRKYCKTPRSDGNVSKFECCDGYMQVQGQKNLTCKAICYPECINGHCVKPGLCRCSTGYTVDPANNRNCLPSCLNGCPEGSFCSGEICRCNHGYNMRNGICSPICTEPCHNGTCVAPEHCLCDPGYRTSDNNTCEPYCSIECNDGRCVGPETCACEPGWRLVGPNTCEPICSTPCFNRVGVARNKCQCDTGHQELDVTDVTESPETTKTEDAFYESTESATVDNTYMLSSTESASRETETASENKSATNTTKAPSTNTEMPQEIWIYVAGGLGVLIVVTIVILAIIFKNSLLFCMKGGNYAVQGQPKRKPDSFNVTFSSISPKHN